jgi:CRISPR-associated endonuclease/helicase Cas3
MRGLERDELVKKSVFTERWLNGELEPADEFNASPVFLISTSAGEVGLDLNADHMICDAAPIDSMIQRLGRVNRRGKGDATAQLYFVPPKKTKDSAAKKLVGVDLSIVNTIHLLTGVTDVSPRSIATLKNSDSWKINYAAACSPEPGILELTDILLDAWSMTSIVSPIPGRPEVAQWIRGVAEELPQTTIAWRAELDLTGFDRLDIEDIEEWFDTHRVLTHEVLRVPSYVATQWLTDRWSKLAPEKKLEIGQRSLVLDRAGMQVLRVSDLLEQLTSKSSDATSAILNTDLILPASFGGIERGKGLLDANAPESSLSEEKCNASSDVADNGDRCRQVITKFEDSAPVIDALGAGVKPPKAARLVLDIQFDELKRVKLVSLVPKKEKLEFGSQRQTLSHHVDLVRKHMDAILSRLHLSDEIKLAAELAANFHDHGKNRERWQRIVNGVATPAGQPWSDTTIGKAGDEMKRDPHGYRHEFGSLCEFAEAFKKSALQDSYGNPVNQDVADLAMHLIATHHGRGRPYFPKGGFDPHAEGQVTSIHSELIRRFALLQIKFGWWQLAWLENLLRCADALASSELAVGIYEATEGRSEE